MEELIKSRPNGQRAAHCREQAKRLRDMAAGESRSELREQLLALAAQYDQMAVHLSRPLEPSSSVGPRKERAYIAGMAPKPHARPQKAKTRPTSTGRVHKGKTKS